MQSPTANNVLKRGLQSAFYPRLNFLEKFNICSSKVLPSFSLRKLHLDCNHYGPHSNFRKKFQSFNIHPLCRNITNISAAQREPEYDIVVVGGGIVGTATAREMGKRHPNYKIAIVEKEDRLAAHQSGHNSGVIHAGIYYKPGSLKAKLCVEGLNLIYEYAEQEGIPYRRCGKLIVATHPNELPRLNALYERSLQNNVPGVCMIDGEYIQEIEPYCKGIKAIHSPNTGIIDFALVNRHYGKNFEDMGGEIHLNFEVNGFEMAAESQGSDGSGNEYPIRITGKDDKSVRCRYVLTCAGLHSDRVAELSGCSGDPHVIPFRGEYLMLKPEKSHMIKGNIYPVPDPRFPFLGVHFTPRMNGDIWLGPNAILALKREGYGWGDVSFRDLGEVLKYRGFQKLALNFVFVGAKEITCSLIPSLQMFALRKYVPSISVRDVKKGPTGVRAQAMNVDGQLVEDFVFHREMESEVGKRVLHCRNAPSPAATSSLSIAKMVADQMDLEFKLISIG